MKRGCRSFNIYFVLTFLLLAAGCSTSHGSDEDKKHKKEQSTIRLYMESSKADTLTSGTVLVTRGKFPYTVEREPFLTEADLVGAQLIDDPNSPGSYAIKLQFTDHGAMLLEMDTADHLGRHIIVFSQFPTPGLKSSVKKTFKKSDDDENLPPPETEKEDPAQPRQSAWLAAVLVHSRIANGTFVFTPDASRSEGIRIVRGLKNVIQKAAKKNR